MKEGVSLPALVIIIALVFAITFLTAPRLSGGWFWDAGNALGLAAFAGIIFQMLPRLKVSRVKTHEWLGYWALMLTLAHVFWFLMGDGTVRFYLHSGAPAHMWLGAGTVILLAILTVIARLPDRRLVHRRYRDFHLVHRILAYGVLITAGLHILLSRFYFSHWSQIGLLVLIMLAACSGWWFRSHMTPEATGRLYLAGSGLAVSLFVLLRNLPA